MPILPASTHLLKRGAHGPPPHGTLYVYTLCNRSGFSKGLTLRKPTHSLVKLDNAEHLLVFLVSVDHIMLQLCNSRSLFVTDFISRLDKYPSNMDNYGGKGV